MNHERTNLPVPQPNARLTPQDTAALTPEYVFAPETPWFDLRKAWSALLRHWVLVASVMIAALTVGLMSIFFSTPVYRAIASVEISNEPAKVLGTEQFRPVTGAAESERQIETQVDILRSRALAESVAQDLNLASNEQFLEDAGYKPSRGSKEEQVIEELRSNLRVSAPRKSEVVPVGFDSSDPSLAADVANQYVSSLIKANLERRFEASNYSKEFLQNQLKLTKTRLESSERALLAYARSVGLVDPSAGGGDPSNPTNSAPRSLTSANLIDLNASLAAATAARIQAEGRWRAAQGSASMNLPEVLGNPAIQQMTERRAELQAQYEQELQRRKTEHPAVQQAAAAIRELDRQIGSLASGIRNSIRNQYEISRAQESQLANTVSRLKSDTLAEQQLGIKYNILKREVDTSRELYNGLLQRYKEVSAEAGVTSNNIAIVDRARPPLLPVLPNPLVNLSLALLLGAISSAVAVMLLELFRDGVRSPVEVEERFGLPLLGYTPKLSKGASADRDLLLSEYAISEAYQTIRTSVELSTRMGTPRTMLVTSSRPGEGKTTTALAMAQHSAASGRKVLLIDADMRKPSLHRVLGRPLEPGLSSFLTQAMIAEDVIHSFESSSLSFISAGPKPPSPAELLSSGGLKALLKYLGGSYDQIIIDGPPVAGLADAPRISAIVDATMLVIEANRSQRGAIDDAINRLSSAGGNVIGAVLTKFDPSKADTGYGYLDEYYGYGEESEDRARPVSAS